MRTPKTLRRVQYTVRGRGIFPFDMLRYDGSRPVTFEDTLWIGPGIGTEPHPWEPIFAEVSGHSFRRDERELMLETYLLPCHGTHVCPPRGTDSPDRRILIPCVARWQSFGWQVTEVYPVVRIPFADVPEWAKLDSKGQPFRGWYS